MSDHELTEFQEKIILEEWNSRLDNPPSLLELIKLAFPDQELDGRTKEGRAVKTFLATRKIKARGAHEYQAKEKIELTQEHRQFIENNANMMNGREIAGVIFANPSLTNLHLQVRIHISPASR